MEITIASLKLKEFLFQLFMNLLHPIIILRCVLYWMPTLVCPLHLFELGAGKESVS